MIKLLSQNCNCLSLSPSQLIYPPYFCRKEIDVNSTGWYNSKRMTVDILMCTYNGEKYIEQQIQSILNQTHTDFRLIIVDDISQDRTVSIIQELMLLDSRIELYQNEKNLGYFNNFLHGLDFVTADYLFFSDQDDSWVKDKIEKQLADLMQEETSVLMSFSNSYLLYDDVNAQTSFETKRDADKIKTYYSTAIELALRNIVAGHTILMRTDSLTWIKERMALLKDKKHLYFDYVLTLLLLEQGKIKYFDESLVYFRQHSDSTSTVMRMNYYHYVSSNALAFSQISESDKTVNYFSVLNKTLTRKSHFLAYFKFLRQNLLHFKRVFNNYDFYHTDNSPSFLKRILLCFRLSYRFYAQK